VHRRVLSFTESLIKTLNALRLREKMKGEMLPTRAYPPPPPPPPQASPKKDSRKMLVIVLLLVIIIVSAGVLFYLATNQSSSGGPTPTPTGTATPTPTGTGASPTPSGASPTATPSGNNQVGSYKAGTWAQYSLESYDEGALVSEGTLKYAIDEGTYSGTACWIMTYEMQMNQDTGTMKTVMTYWISKSTMEGIHVKTQIYMNDDLISENEEDLTPGDSGDMPEQIDMTTATSYETITVPAGTFNCGKNTITTSVSGVTHTTSTWASTSVPILGLVKTESLSDGVVVSTMELISYHS
jgi:hypothetical protein